MDSEFLSHLSGQLHAIEEDGLFKEERIMTSSQDAHIRLLDGRQVLNFCANNYLGLANNEQLIDAAIRSFSKYGFGMASVRFICGTLDLHRELERQLSSFLETDDTILYSSCFDANGGLFETILGPEDAIISDSLNHASIIDGIRLSKAERHRYQHNDMADLEEKLKATQDKRFRLISTDGVFSMDGTIADLKTICDLADKYKALVMVDDCHATGFLGEKGKGTPEYCGVLGRVDILTGTLGKALGGASGGYTSGKKEIIRFLRQRSRPYLFSNTLMPAITAASLEVLQMIKDGSDRRVKLKENTRMFREKITSLGFQILPGSHPIVPIMLGDAKLAQEFAKQMLQEGVYVIGFSYPVVPMGKARIRTQMSAAHSTQDLEFALQAFKKVGKALNVIK